ncbi:MAG: Chloramphenicol 3-O phosphotransferase [Chlamydiales bacterium]|nr:Chloramphenicol 3-O phosphotransferase [Chlamydiales bacterium]
MAKIIYLNGPTSAGKTTLAKALQEALEEPFLHLGIDKIIGLMPAKINDWEGGPAPLGFSWETDTDPEGHRISHVRAGPFAKRIVDTLKDVALLFASQNYNLIIDDVAFGTVEVEEWKQILKDYDVLYVGVVTPLNILEKRERARGDRFAGSARAQYYSVHENVAYDLEVDSHAHTLEESVAMIKEILMTK